MKTLSVGKDVISFHDFGTDYPNIVDMVYDYERKDDGTGDGWVVLRLKDGWNFFYLGHDSTYEPIDNIVEDTPNYDTLTELVESFRNPSLPHRFNKVVEYARNL
jgi:hypothetical protein